MANHGKRKFRNFGFGRNPKHAAKNALRDYYAGHFGTVAAHSQRWDLFCDWLRIEHRIQDARLITVEIVDSYSQHLALLRSKNEIAISTATNRLSSVNVVMKIMREDNYVRIAKLAQAVGGKRSYVRRRPPEGMCLELVSQLQRCLEEHGFNRVAAIVGLARSTGMRLREAILADLPRLLCEANSLGRINIQDGTKGGRGGAFAPRWVPATDAALAAIAYALEVSPTNSRNLLAGDETYQSFTSSYVKPSRDVLRAHGIRGFHELRASYACEHFQQLCGLPAPVIARPDIRSNEMRESVRIARQQVSRELGHERTEVTNAYLGSEKV